MHVASGMGGGGLVLETETWWYRLYRIWFDGGPRERKLNSSFKQLNAKDCKVVNDRNECHWFNGFLFFLLLLLLFFFFFFKTMTAFEFRDNLNFSFSSIKPETESTVHHIQSSLSTFGMKSWTDTFTMETTKLSFDYYHLGAHMEHWHNN